MAGRKSRDKSRTQGTKAERAEGEPRRRRGASIVAWIMLAMILVGLGGFGITNFGGGITNVASVGSTEISVQDYQRALQQELRALSAQSGKNVSFQQAKAMGIDQQVMARLIVTAALDDENSRLGISVGNDKLTANITAMRAFQGADGKFSPEAYRFVLKQNGLSEGQFERQIRHEMSRTILQDAVLNGFGTPTPYVKALMSYIGERRGFEILKLGPDNLKTPVPAPTEAELMAWYKAHPKDYTSPPAKRITYAELTPDMLAPKIKVTATELANAYAANAAEYDKPARRLVERLVYPTEAAAKAARAKLDAGTASFDDLVKARGLDLTSVDMGDVSKADLSPAAAKAVFAGAVHSVVGPVQSALGPALFRINGVLAAAHTSLADATPDLTSELQQEKAKAEIQTQIEKLSDILAGGATLEQLVKESDMTLGTIDFTAESDEGIAGYEAFRKAAAAVTKDDFPSIIQLDDGGLVALRLDKQVAPALIPFDKVRDQVAQDWTKAATDKALKAEAEATVKAAEAPGGTLVPGTSGAQWEAQAPITRTGYLDGAPSGFLTGVFKMKKGEVKSFAGAEEVWVAKLTDILPPDMTDPDMTKVEAQLKDDGSQGIANDAFLLFANAIQSLQTVKVNQAAVTAVNSQFH